MPQNTDLVTDLPADFEVFGQAVATSMADLLGGSSGYILSKASATDMDFTWIANDQGDITGVTAGTGITVTSPTGPVPTVSIDTATTVDKTTSQTLTNKTLTSPVLTTPSISNINAKGDILVGTADNTLGIITAGNDGETLVADSGTATGLRYQGSIAGGRNALINGAFDYWNRGTSGFTAGGAFNADRWKTYYDGTGSTQTISQQPLTAGSIVGIDSPFCYQWSQTVAGSGATTNQVYQLVENVQTYAGQTVVLSFYAKSDATRTAIAPTVNQNFGSGGSTTVAATVTAVSGNPTNLTTSWQRFSYTVVLASITGKTVGTSSYLEVSIKLPINTTQVSQIVGVQFEVGSVPTQFSRAGGTLQGELAACQRYFIKYILSGFSGHYYTTTNFYPVTVFPVEMRVTPSFTVSAAGAFDVFAAGAGNVSTAVGTDNTTTKTATIALTTAARTAGFAGEARLKVNESISWSAEL